jgi:hypothetical protein
MKKSSSQPRNALADAMSGPRIAESAVRRIRQSLPLAQLPAPKSARVRPSWRPATFKATDPSPAHGNRCRKFSRRNGPHSKALFVSDERRAKPALLVMPPASVHATPWVEIDFKKLDDGRIIEAIENPADSTKTTLAILDRGKIALADEVNHGGQVLVPVARASHGLGDVSLPRAPKRYQSAEQVFFQVRNLISSCVSIPDIYSIVISAAVMNSWFADRLQPPIYLLITGLPQSGKTTLLQMMRLLCRRALLASEISPAAANDACSRLGCTLLLDENDWRSNKNSGVLRKQLRAGTSKGMLVKHLGKTQHTFGMKILGSVELPDDAALRSRCIHVPMEESDRADLRKPWDPAVVAAADSLRGQLLQLRLEKYTSVQTRIIPGMEKLRPRSRDLLSTLLAPLKGVKLLEELLLTFFLHTHDPSTRDLLSPELGAVVAALFEFVHLRPSDGYIQVSAVAKLANDLLRSSGERFILNPRKCSDLLSSLGFVQRARSNQGSLVCLHKDAVAKIHGLQHKHGQDWLAAANLKSAMEGCGLCKRYHR